MYAVISSRIPFKFRTAPHHGVGQSPGIPSYAQSIANVPDESLRFNRAYLILEQASFKKIVVGNASTFTANEKIELPFGAMTTGAYGCSTEL